MAIKSPPEYCKCPNHPQHIISKDEKLANLKSKLAYRKELLKQMEAEIKELETTQDNTPKEYIKPQLNIIELFAGIGAPTQALLKKYNVFHVEAVEFDKHAIKSYNALYRNGGMPQFHPTNILDLDLKTAIEKNKEMLESDNPQIDLLHMSPPCTKFSVQGKGGGDRDDETAKMWDKCVDFVELWKPNYISYENVKQTKGTIIFTQLDFNLTELGYEMIYDNVLNAKNFGLPQNRERYFVVWCKKELASDNKYRMLRDYVNAKSIKPTPTLKTILDFTQPTKIANAQPMKIKTNDDIFIYESNSQNGKAVIIENEKLDDINSKDKKHIVATIQQETNLDLDNYNKLKFNSDSHFLGVNGISGTVCAKSYAGFQNKVMYHSKLIFNYDNAQLNGKAVIIETEKLKNQIPNDKRNIVATIQDETDLDLENYNKSKFHSNMRFSGINGISGTICAQPFTTFQNKVMYLEQENMEKYGKSPIHYRNLTTIELGRLQGFRDDVIEHLLTINSESQVNKQIGNSIAVNCLEAIYDAIDFKGEK